MYILADFEQILSWKLLFASGNTVDSKNRAALGKNMKYLLAHNLML